MQQPVVHDFYELQTEVMPALQLHTARLVLPTPKLAIDADGFQYLASHDKWTEGKLWDDTICQLESLCERYYTLAHGRYPSEILLCEGRYNVRPFIANSLPSRRIGHFYPRQMSARPIPYAWPCDAKFEIIVRGEV